MHPVLTTEVTRRLFIGLMAPAEIREQLMGYRSTWTWPKSAKLTPAGNFHLTLAFLGDVARDSEIALLRELAAVRLRPFALQLDTPGRFMRADIAYVAPTPLDELTFLHEGVSSAMERCGMAAEGDWHPHVTLARGAASAIPPTHRPIIDWQVNSFSLVLSAAGRYDAVETWPARA